MQIRYRWGEKRQGSMSFLALTFDLRERGFIKVYESPGRRASLERLNEFTVRYVEFGEQ